MRGFILCFLNLKNKLENLKFIFGDSRDSVTSVITLVILCVYILMVLAFGKCNKLCVNHICLPCYPLVYDIIVYFTETVNKNRCNQCAYFVIIINKSVITIFTIYITCMGVFVLGVDSKWNYTSFSASDKGTQEENRLIASRGNVFLLCFTK